LPTMILLILVSANMNICGSEKITSGV